MNLIQDLRFAFRTFSKTPGLVAAIVISIGLGVAANSTVFSVINSLLWGTLPVHEPEKLMSMGESTLSWPDYQDLREGTRSVFDGGVTAFFPLIPASIGGNGEPERVWGQSVAANYWHVAGAQPSIGRAFTEDEDKPGANPVVILTHGIWQRRFGGDPSILGRQVLLNGGPFEVVGVAPRGFGGTIRVFVPDFFVPLGSMARIMPDMPSETLKAQRGSQWLMLNARLLPGVSREQAQAAVNVVKQRIDTQFRKKEDQRKNYPLRAAGGLPFGDAASVFGVATVMMVVVGLVLLIACANVANLLLARAAARRKEIGIRLAMGASRKRLIGQLLTESILLSFGGAAFGLVLAFGATRALQQISLPFPLPIAFDFAPDARVFVFTACLALVTGIVFGLAPALRSTRTDLMSVIKDDFGALGTFRRFGLRNGLVVAQVALSLVLLVCATLFLRSLRSATSIDLGFKADNVLLMTMDPKLQGYSKERSQQLVQQLRERVKALPGVVSVSYLDSVPLSFGGTTFDFTYATPKGKKSSNGDVYSVGSSFFETFGIPIVRGRDFDSHRDGRFVVIVNEAMARELAGGEDLLGKQIGVEDNPVEPGKLFEVVGIVRNTKSRTLGEDLRPCAYMFLEPAPETLMSFYGMSIAVKTSVPPRSLERAVREQVRAFDANMPVHDAETMQEHVDKSMLLPRVCATLLGVFGAIGLILATVGLYGVISYSVRSRVREIGVRMALGAEASRVSLMVTRQGLALVGVGLVIGLLVAFALTRFLASLLYGISATDLVTFIGVPIVMVLVGLAATALPARKAAQIDPMEAVRYQ